MIVGVTVDPRAYAARIPVFPNSRMCRVFGYASKALPAWRPVTGDKRVETLRSLVPGIEPACVFQDWPDDATTKARVEDWLDELDGPARLCWRHEADRKRVEPAEYRYRYFRLASWVAEHANGERVTLTPTQTYQWTMSKAPGKGAGDWSRYYTGIGNVGIDVYANSWESDYPDPEAFLAPIWRYRDTVGQDIEFPEFGAARVRGDDDGGRRASFLYACGSIMAREGVVSVSYWDDLGTGGTDLRLWADDPDTPEVAAWRAVVDDNNGPAAPAPTSVVDPAPRPVP